MPFGQMQLKYVLHPLSAALSCDPQGPSSQLEQALVPELTPSSARHAGES
jgi:hypothetical protein